jgi:hypothetical protein
MVCKATTPYAKFSVACAGSPDVKVGSGRRPLKVNNRLWGNRLTQKFYNQVIVGLAISIITPVQNWFVRRDLWPIKTSL